MDTLSLLKEYRKNLESQIAVNNFNIEKLEKLRQQRVKGGAIYAKLSKQTSNLEKSKRELEEYKAIKKRQDSNQITTTITTIANMTFPEYDYTYKLESEYKRGFNYSRLIYEDSKGRKFSPAISNGKGLRQLISAGGVAVVTALSDVTPTLVLDECFASLSPDKMKVASQILKQLSDYGIQFILIEHDDALFEYIDYTEVYLTNDGTQTRLLDIKEVKNGSY